MTNEAIKEVIEHGIDRLDEYKGQAVEASELHYHLYNEDYFVIGYWKAAEFLKKYGIFEAIGEVEEYEKDIFGEVTTNLGNSEAVANMWAYIKGEEALNKCVTLADNWDARLTDKQLDAIKSELEAQL